MSCPNLLAHSPHSSAYLSSLYQHLSSIQSQIQSLKDSEQQLRQKLKQLLKKLPRTDHLPEILQLLDHRHTVLVSETQAAVEEMRGQVELALRGAVGKEGSSRGLSRDTQNTIMGESAVQDRVAAIRSSNLAVARDFSRRLQQLQQRATLKLREADVNTQHYKQTIKRQVEEICRLNKALQQAKQNGRVSLDGASKRGEYGLRLVSLDHQPKTEDQLANSQSRSRSRDRRKKIFEKQSNGSLEVTLSPIRQIAISSESSSVDKVFFPDIFEDFKNDGADACESSDIFFYTEARRISQQQQPSKTKPN